MMALVLFQLLSQDPAAPIIDGQQLRIMGPFPTALVMLEWHKYTKPQLIIQIYQRFTKANHCNNNINNNLFQYMYIYIQ